MGNTDTCTLQHSLSKCKCAEGPFGAHHDICPLPSTSLPTPVNSCTAPWPRRPRRCHRRQQLVSAVKALLPDLLPRRAAVCCSNEL